MTRTTNRKFSMTHSWLSVCLAAAWLTAGAARGDTFFVAGSGNGTVERFDGNGTSLGAFPAAHLTTPTAIALDGSGNLYVAGDQTPASIEKFASDGTDLGTFANTNLVRVYGLAFDGAGNLYAANYGNGTVEKFSPTGTDLGAFVSANVSGPVGLAFDGAGNLYVANNSANSVAKFAADGTYLGVFASTGLAVPFALAFDAGGNLYVSNYGTNTVRRFSATGTDLGDFVPAGTLAAPLGLVFDGGGNLYVSNETSGVVDKFDPAGNPLGVFATDATGSAPAGIARSAAGTPVGTTAPTVALTSPPDGITVAAGEAVPLIADVTDPSGVLAQVQFSVNGQVLATTGATAPFMATETIPAAGTYVLQAVSTDTAGRTSTSRVTVTAVAADPLSPSPSSNLLTPVAGRNLAAGTTLTLSATAASSVAGLDHVSIYADGVVVATFDAAGNVVTDAFGGKDAPVRQDASAIPLDGLFTTLYRLPGLDKFINLIVAATDKLGRTTVSSAASFHSTVTTDHAPVVGFSNLGASASVSVGATSVAAAVASDPDAASGQGAIRQDAGSDGVLAALEFWINGVNLAKASTPSANFSFTTALAGRYVLHAVATDAAGLSTVSSPVVVTANPLPPTVSVAVAGDGRAIADKENGKVAVRRAGDLTGALTVRYKVKGAAVAGTNYKLLTGTAVIPAGAAQVKIKIKPIRDAAEPPDAALAAKIKLLPALDNSYTLGPTGTTAKVQVISND